MHNNSKPIVLVLERIKVVKRVGENVDLCDIRNHKNDIFRVVVEFV